MFYAQIAANWNETNKQKQSKRTIKQQAGKETVFWIIYKHPLCIAQPAGIEKQTQSSNRGKNLLSQKSSHYPSASKVQGPSGSSDSLLYRAMNLESSTGAKDSIEVQKQPKADMPSQCRSSLRCFIFKQSQQENITTLLMWNEKNVNIDHH